MSNFEIIHADSKDFLATYRKNDIDCIFTSPYPIRLQYDYVTILHILGVLCKRVLKPQGSMWIHMEDSYNDKGSLRRWPARFSTEMISSYDWILRAERIWHIPVGDSDYFNEGKIVDNNRLILDHCYVFHFTQARYGYYNSFEYLKGQPCSIFTDKLEKLDPNGFETGFSKELMKQSLLMSCPPEGKVLDPFCGSGSTGVTALSLGMSFLGIEIDETKISKIEQRLGKVSTTIVPQ